VLRTRLLLQFAELPMANAATSARPAAAHLLLLGEPRLLLADGSAHALERKDAALLALLAVDGATPRGKAASLLWPDVDDDAARNNLRQRLHRLRKRATRDVAVSANDVLRLADDVVHDLTGLQARLADDAATGTGDLLGTFDYEDCDDLNEWIAIAREQWRAARRNALAEIASRLETEGHIALALQYAERLVTDDPLLEHAHRRLMRLHYLRGDRAAALAAFARCREVLVRHLKAQPARETLELARLVEASGALPVPVAPPRPVAVLRPPRLVGRDTDWRLLQQAWEQERIALVVGEPGIGKTRLLTDFASAQQAVLITGARPGDARVPYALLARLLRAALQWQTLAFEPWVRDELARLLPELGAAPSDRLEPVRLQRAAADAISSWQQAGLQAIVIDDLHFADDASLEAVLTLIGAERGATWRWLLGVRANEQPTQLAEWRRLADPEVFVEVQLAPLDAAAIEALLESLALPDFAPRVWAEPLARHTGGNPLFILETLNALLAQEATRLTGTVANLPAPGSVGQLIERRLGQLSAPALRLARVAALAGQDFSVELAAQVLGTHPLDLTEAWRELETAQVIRDDAFAHDLIFEATLRSIPAPIARLLHREIAHYLDAHAGPATRVAQHWVEAQEWPRAAVALVAAANAALETSRRDDELRLLEAAVAAFERCGEPARQFDCANRAFDAALHAGDMKRVADWVALLQRLAQSDAQRARAWVAEALAHNVVHRTAEAVRAATRALEEANRAGEVELEISAKQQLANAMARQGRAGDAIALMEPMLARLETGVDPLLARQVLADFAFLLEHGDRRREAIAWRDKVIEQATAANDWSAMHLALTDQGLSIYYLGEIEPSLALYERARSLHARLGEGKGWSLLDDMAMAGHYRELGRFDEALHLTHDTLAAMRRGGFDAWIYNTENDLANAYVALGQTQRALNALTALPDDVPSWVRAGRLATRARVERWRGQPSRALYEQAHALVAELDTRSYVRLKLDIEVARELPREEGVDRLAILIEEATTRQYGGLERHATAYRIEALQALGDAAAASALAHRSLTAFDQRAPVSIYPPELWWILFQAFEAAVDRTSAGECLQRAVTWIKMSALPNVPGEFKDSFLHRNPINRTILTTASRRLR
jgi:DNA-binding SARP family transcriptional activator/tetratricopeptide (TPR) repeat protein